MLNIKIHHLCFYKQVCFSLCLKAPREGACITVDIILTSCLENFMYRTSRPVVSILLKSLQRTCPTVMLMLGQRCHDVRTMCITKLICVLGNIVYITWRIIFVNTSGYGDHVSGGGPSGGNWAPPTEVGVHFYRHPSIWWRTFMTTNLWWKKKYV